jgi:hypothetical protein
MVITDVPYWSFEWALINRRLEAYSYYLNPTTELTGFGEPRSIPKIMVNLIDNDLIECLSV